jgi:hypothetical protein
MKLITEHTDQELEYITEGTGPKKDMFISGIFMQAEKQNRNGRVYPKKIMEGAIARYDEQYIKTKRAVGELNHPEGPTINLDKVSHIITELKWQGNDIMGKAKILNTPMGIIAKGLIEGGVQLGVSSRGMGSLTSRGGQNMVGEDFVLSTVDIVQDPSAHDAFVNGIMEGAEWIHDAVKDSWVKQEVLHTMIAKERKKKFINEDALIKQFKDLLF